MEKNNLFKLLRLRTNHAYAELSQEEQDRTTFFKDSVDVLERYSKFIEDVLGKKNSILETFDLDYKNGCNDFGDEVYNYFEQLKTLSIFVPKLGYKLGQDILPSGLFEFLIKTKGTERSYFLNKSPNQEFSIRQVRKLINWIRGNTNSISWNKKYDDSFLWNEYVRLCSEFDAVIAKNLDIKVLCIDIQLKNNHTDNYENFNEDFRRINWDYAGKVCNYLNDFPDFIHGFFKYENDHQFGLNLHCILFFEGKGKLNTKAKIQKLKEKIIRDKFESGVEIRDWLVQLKKITQQDFSKISYHQQECIQYFKYWVLGYYAYIDRIIKLDHKDSHNRSLPINGIFEKQDRSVPIDPQEAYRKHIEFWKKLIEGNNPQKIWQCQNLSKDAIERITVTELIYKEYAKLDTRFADLVEVGVRLEIFIENLLASNSGLFDFPRQFNEFNPLTTDELTYSITKSCQQYFSLLDQQDKIQRLLNYSSNGMTSFLLTSITIQLKAFFSKGVIGDKFNLDLQKITALNMKSLILKKRYQVHTHLDGSLKIRTNQVSQNFNRAEANIIQHKICARRYATAIDYFDRMSMQDLVVYRIQFILAVKACGSISQKEFSMLFTSFIRFGKRAQPLSKCVGYLGCWSLNIQSKTIADVLFFFPRTKLTEGDAIATLIIDYWHKFLKTHFEAKIKKDPQNIYSDTKSIEVFSSQMEFNSKFVLFNVNDRKKQNLFKQTVVKYLAYKEIFQPKLVNPIGKVLIKGSTSKVAQASNPKN